MTNATIDRRELLGKLVPNPDDYLIISGLAGAARDAAALTEDGDNLFTMAGAMGAAVSMGLGVAMSAPDRQVLVITGDGELMMNMGGLATVASAAPKNLSIICIDNGVHAETGGQLGHTSRGTDLAMVAQGTGLTSVMKVTNDTEIDEAAKFLTGSAAPRFLLVKVTDGPPASFKRNMDPTACRIRFRNAYMASA
jgi:thiamine pyrophosphate-dependent acetolactate synthase large subunit-like protein